VIHQVAQTDTIPDTARLQRAMFKIRKVHLVAHSLFSIFRPWYFFKRLAVSVLIKRTVMSDHGRGARQGCEGGVKGAHASARPNREGMGPQRFFGPGNFPFI